MVSCRRSSSPIFPHFVPFPFSSSMKRERFFKGQILPLCSWFLNEVGYSIFDILNRVGSAMFFVNLVFMSVQLCLYVSLVYSAFGDALLNGFEMDFNGLILLGFSLGIAIWVVFNTRSLIRCCFVFHFFIFSFFVISCFFCFQSL